MAESYSPDIDIEDGAALLGSLTGASAIGPLSKLAYGIYQDARASKRLKSLGAMPEYAITPEQRSSQIRAEKMAKFGYSPQEAAAFEQSLARSGNTAFQRGLTIGGGGVSSAINAAINSNNINARLGFAADNARLKRQNIQYADQRGDIISNQRNRDTAQKLAYRMAVEQALGTAKSQGAQNIVESASDVPYILMQAAYLNSLKPKKQGNYGIQEFNPRPTNYGDMSTPKFKDFR